MTELERLRALVYRYYPRDRPDWDSGPDDTDEHRRLVEARKRAGRDDAAFRALLDRLARRFPDLSVQNNSLHLPTGGWDACYSALLWLPPRAGETDHALGLLLSFIAPLFVIYSSSQLAGSPAPAAGPAPTDAAEFGPDFMIMRATPAVVEPPAPRHEVRYSFSPDEAPFASALAAEVQSVFPGWTALPPEIGLTVVPDVVAGNRGPGEATLYDCLFTDNR